MNTSGLRHGAWRRALLFVCIVLGAGGRPAHAAPPTGRGFTLEFEDNFDGTALDTDVWRYRTDTRSIPAGTPQCANLAANVSVSGGYLRIAGKVENYTTGGVTYPSTGGGVLSNPIFKYGYYETRAKLTDLPGWHNSYWQLGSNGAGLGAYNEIDGWEVDSHAPRVLGYNTHHYEPAQDQWMAASYTLPVGSGTADTFHVYGWEWTPEKVVFYVDGVVTAQIPYPGAHAAQQIWLTCLGWDRGHGRQGPVEIQFDYFRYYRKDYGFGDGGVIVAPATTGTWTTSARAFDHDDDRDTLYSTTAGATATWTPTLTMAGNYEVFFWNPSYFKSTSTNTTFSISGATGVESGMPVDQIYDGQQWVSLGAFKFNSGTGGSVSTTVPSGTTAVRVGSMMFRRFALLDDDFDDGDSVGWTTPSGSWSVVSSAFKVTGTAESVAHWSAQSWLNYFVRASVKLTGASAIGGVLGRYSDTNNYYLFRVNAANGKVELYKKVAGTWNTLRTVDYGVTTGVSYELILIMDGANLRGLVNGFEVFDVVDSALTSGTVGLRAVGGDATFDQVGAASY